MQKRWLELVAWCTAFGVPMTPLAQTWVGYGLIVAALIVVTLRGWTWINDALLIRISTPAKLTFLIPSVLLIVMAAVWSYFGGLPALLESKKIPSMASGDIKILGYEPHPPQEGKGQSSFQCVEAIANEYRLQNICCS